MKKKRIKKEKREIKELKKYQVNRRSLTSDRD
jgi:hypothetical protein